MPYKNKEKWNEWNRERHRRNREFFEQLLNETPCTDCGLNFPWYVMEFDHVPERGPKLYNMSNVSGNRSWKSKSVQEELRKCDIVCGNCHNTRTHFRKTR